MDAATRDAIHAWAEGALAMPAIWADGNGPAPTKAYATLKLSGPARLGFGPEATDETNLGAPAGQEITQTAREHQEWSLSVQVFAAKGASAVDLLEAGALRMRLPGRLQQLRAAGVVLVEAGDTQDLSALFATAIESRAAMDVRLRTVGVASEQTTYIGKVDGTSPWGPWTSTT